MKSSWTLTKVLDDSRSEVSPWLPVLTLIVLLSTAILWLLTACTDPGARWYPVVSGGLGTRFGGRVCTVTGGHAVVHHETP